MSIARSLSSCFGGLMLLILLNGAVGAASITDGSVSGPGGVGSPNFFSNVSEASLQYNSNNYLDITLTVNGAGYFDLSQAPSLGGVLNHTGTTWTGFVIEIIASDMPVVFTTLQVAPPGYPYAYDYGGKFPIVNWTPTQFTLSGGTVSDFTSLAPVSAFQTDGAGTVVFRETPIVPEPTSLLLAGVGAVLAVGLGRKHRAQHKV